MSPWVLMYHSVSTGTDDPLRVTVPPDRFEAQLRWLRRRGLRGVSVSELLDAGPVAARSMVGLTFDDGYADFAGTVVPALRRQGFGATVYVLADRLGGHNSWESQGPRKDLMTAAQVRAVAEEGFEVGSHGLTHISLTQADDPELAAEVQHSRERLAEATGQPVRGFAYPYGYLGAREAAAVAAAGYDHGAAIWRGPQTGRHALMRTYVGAQDGGLRLAAKHVRHRVRTRRSPR